MAEVHINFLNTKVQMLTLQTGMPPCNLDAFAGAEAKWGLFRDAAFRRKRRKKPRKTTALLSLSGLQDYSKQRLF